jgi:plastocyanin
VKRLFLLVIAVVCVSGVPAHAGPVTLVVATTAGQEFAPPTLVVPQGASLQFVQLDPSARHDVVSVFVVNRKPLFSTKTTAAFGETLTVNGVEKLKPATYPFTCSIHEWMSGQLIVR